MKKKLLSLLVSACMLVTLIPGAVFAMDADVTEDVDQPATVEELGEGETDPGTLNEDPAASGWQQTAEGNWQYFQEGVAVTGLLTFGNNSYYFDDTGIMQTGWQIIGGERYYFDKTPIPEGKTPADPGVTFGIMAIGWQTIDGNKYYFSTKDGKMKTGWQTIGGKKYYFNKNSGKMHTEWLNLDGSKYYLDKSTGVMKTGWLTLSKKKYYLDTKTGKAKKGLVTISKETYYFDSSCVMKTGLVTISGDLYYFKTTGKAFAKGWLEKNSRYCFGKGKLATGTEKIGSTWYEFNKKTGKKIRTIGDDTDKKVQKYDGLSKGYLIYIKRSTHQVRLYKGQQNAWKRAKTYSCTVGAPSTPTPAGTFTVKKKVEKDISKVGSKKYTFYYQLQLWDNSTGHHGVQSVLYYQGKVYDGAMGKNLSKGSVRLTKVNAQYLYNTVKIGTKTVIE